MLSLDNLRIDQHSRVTYRLARQVRLTMHLASHIAETLARKIRIESVAPANRVADLRLAGLNIQPVLRVPGAARIDTAAERSRVDINLVVVALGAVECVVALLAEVLDRSGRVLGKRMNGIVHRRTLTKEGYARSNDRARGDRSICGGW